MVLKVKVHFFGIEVCYPIPIHVTISKVIFFGFISALGQRNLDQPW